MSDTKANDIEFYSALSRSVSIVKEWLADGCPPSSTPKVNIALLITVCECVMDQKPIVDDRRMDRTNIDGAVDQRLETKSQAPTDHVEPHSLSPSPLIARPPISEATIQAAAHAFAVQNGWTHALTEDLIAVYRPYMNGYAIAKELEDKRGWSITASDVEVLDSFEIDVRELHRQACIAWEREHAVKPPFPIGTVILQGQITGISDREPATYLVKEHGLIDGRSRLLIKFEDAKLPAGSTPANVS